MRERGKHERGGSVVEREPTAAVGTQALQRNVDGSCGWNRELEQYAIVVAADGAGHRPIALDGGVEQLGEERTNGYSIPGDKHLFRIIRNFQ
jgi:hypothetical protein